MSHQTTFCPYEEVDETKVQDSGNDIQSPRSQSPTNGGVAWLSVVAGFLGFVIAWGPTTAFGIFQDYYQRTILANSTASDIAWIGTVNAFLLVATGVCSGPLFDRGYGKVLICTGCLIVVFGMMMLSISQKYYQIMLAQGVCSGIGAGIIYVPILALVNSTFVSVKRAVANGFVTLGASVGGILFPIVFLRLEPRIGFAWTVRTLAFLQLGCSLMAFASISSIPFPKAGRTRNIVQLGAFRELAFSSFSVFGFLVMMGYFIPMIYVPAYAVQKLGSSTDTGLYLLAGLNAGSGVGRLAGPLFAMRVGPANLLLGATVVCGVLVFLWIPVTSIASLAVVSVLFGIFCGAMIAIIPLVAVHPLISPHPDVIGTRMGMVWFVASIGILIGAPIAGALKSSSSHSFLGLQVFAGAVIMGSVVFISITSTLFRRHRR